MNEVWAGLATLLERKIGRFRAVESLMPQVDRLTIHPGDGRGDQLKFASCADAPDVFISVDDDLIYPPDFVEWTLAGLERYPGCIVAYGGWRLDADGNRGENFRALATVADDTFVDVVTTCACAFHVDTIRPTLADFPMMDADIWLAVKAAREQVPRVVLAHDADFFGYVQPTRTIWSETKHETGSSLDITRPRELGLLALRDALHEGAAHAQVP